MPIAHNKRCGEIELFRFLFSVIIMLRHADNLLGENICFPGGAFGVEFFFLVSGFLMMASIDRTNQPIYSLGDETLAFIHKKVRVLYPEVLVSLLIAFLIQCIAKNYTFVDAVKLACDSLYEMLLLSHSGLGSAKLIGPIWYLSSMILSMYILYPLIRKYKDTMVKVVLPLVSIFALGFVTKNYNHFRTPAKWLFFVYKGFLRGMGELCLGALLYYAAKYLKRRRFTTFGKWLLTAAKWGCWLTVIAYMSRTTIAYDAFFLAIFAIAISLSFSMQCADVRLYDCRLVYFLGKFSLPLYLNHRYYSLFFNSLVPNHMGRAHLLAIYITLAFFTAGFVMVLCALWRKEQVRVCRKLKKLLLIQEPASRI